ncbi:MAG: extracellular solute-binding protein [Anaerolineaceae bacterium]|nr:MAG: extracellular solute-binding protein [Anaerolineaceae bacterium]
MRNTLYGLMLVLALLTVGIVAAQEDEDAGFVVPDELRGGEIIVYSPFPDEQMIALSAPFTEMTGIRVLNIVISTGETYSRLIAESGNPQADFWLSARAAIIQDALQEDPPLVIEYKPSTLDQIAEVYQYPDSTFFTGVGMYPLVVFYNTQALEEEGLDVPETYLDLLDEQYRGQIVMPHPATSGTSYSAITSFLQIFTTLEEDIDEEALADLDIYEEGWEYVRALAQNVDQFTRSGRAPQNLVAQGEYPIGIGFFDAVYYLGVDGFPIVSVFPDPIFADPYTAAVVNGAPNEERAKLFFDYLLTAEAQAVLLDFGNYSVREDIDPPEGGKPLAEMDVLNYDWQLWGELREMVLDRFIDETQVEVPE